MTIRTSWLFETGQTREDTRLTQLGATLPADPLRVQTGILPGSADGIGPLAGFALSDQTAMGATVQPGRAVVQGLANQGAYPVTLAEAAVLTFTDGDQQDRIDLVCIQLADASYSSPTTSAALTVIQGAASATPQPPAVPALALPLYTVAVPAGASAATTGIPWSTAVQDLRVSTVATGGVLPVCPAGAALPGAYVGQLRDHDNVIERWSGSAWVAYPQGIGGIVPTGAGTTNGSYVGQYRDNSGRLERWDGHLWQSVFPSTTAFAYLIDAGSTQSTTYVNTLNDTQSNPLDVYFTAPPTGAVLVTVGAAIHTTGDATTTGFMSAAITQNGTAFFAQNDDYAARGTGDYENSVVCTYVVDGLTSGATCTATAWFRSNNATKVTWFDNCTIRVEPFNTQPLNVHPL